MFVGSVRPVIVIFALLFVLYVSALLFGWFDSFSSFDLFMHFFGGVWAGSLFLFLSRGFFQQETHVHVVERLKTTTLVIAYGSFIGVLWEFLEYVLAPYFQGFEQSSVRDTLGDLFMDILGSGAYALVLFFLIPFFIKKISGHTAR